MRINKCSWRRLFPRLFAWGVAGLLLAGAPVWLAAQAPAKKAKEEVEDPKSKPPAKTPKPEEEDPAQPAKPKAPPLRVEDEEAPAGASKPDKTAAPRLSELAREAKNAPQDIQNLYRQLWPPYDVVTWRPGTKRRTMKIEPFPARIADEKTVYNGANPMRTLAEGDQKPIDQEFQRTQVKAIDPFELVALGQIKTFLAAHKDSIDHLHAAERALKAVEGFHESSRELARREGPGWDKVSGEVRAQLRDVQTKALQYYSDKNDWDDAYSMAAELATAYPKPEMHKVFIKPLEHFVWDLMKAGKFVEAKTQLARLDAILPVDTLHDPVTRALEEQALRWMAESKDKKPEEAIRLLANAELLAPRLRGLVNRRLELSNQSPVLQVGVSRSSLPQKLTPGEACTYPELLALDLMFESLVKPIFSPEVGQRYVPNLAADQPRLIPLGREFELIRDAYWSDGKPVRAGDVRSTVEKLLSQQRGGASDNSANEQQPLHAALAPDDAYHVSILLRRGFLDPLALMSFKILPDRTQHPPDPTAIGPICSGPFVLKSKAKDKVVFKANDYYHRAARPGLPYIREIHFFESSNPAAEFGRGAGRMHLLLDITSQDYRNLESSLGASVRCFTLTPRRVYFLSVNHRKPELQNEDVRRAIGLAINRKEILDRVFRPQDGGKADKFHRPLNGPFPHNSWAYDKDATSMREDPWNPNIARRLKENASAAFMNASRLTLKYPNDDPRVKQACEEIRQQVKAETNIDLVLDGMAPYQLRKDVEEDHKYDLAYYHLDYPNELYWLWPLFDPDAMGKGGSNYLGYYNDSELQSKFTNALGHRDVGKVREFMHDIHRQIHRKMPLIPLWQLDMHFAVHEDLVMSPREARHLDPLMLFGDIEHWKLQSFR